MFRTLLIYPLLLAVAFGPLLCCCTVGRALAAALQTPAKTSRPETPVPGSPALVHPCCAHKHQPAHKPADPKPTPPDPGPCPCKDGANKVQATQPADTVAELTEYLRILCVDLVTPVSGAGLLAPVALRDGRTACGPPLSFLSPSDLLFAQHKLRC